jgi:hypothetical protein
MAESKNPKRKEAASSPDELIKDLDIEVTEADARAVVGGKGKKDQQEFLVVKLTDVIITGVQ